MALLLATLLEILQRPTIWDVCMDLALFVAPLWIAVLVGVCVGWAWKPSWATFMNDFVDNLMPKAAPASSFFACIPTFDSLKLQLPTYFSWIEQDEKFSDSLDVKSDCSDSSQIETELSSLVNKNDFHHLSQLVEVKDGGPGWIQMMDRCTSKMRYKAWRRDMETGPPQYRSSTIFEDASPEIVRDFFWDDDFRSKWDDMLIFSSTLEKCPVTGTMLVNWVRKFPFFCSDREYIIGRRIWEHNGSYYCVTKGVPSSSVPRRSKPKRVDSYYSSWCIRAVESKRGNGEMSACEVLLFHHEDMGIPWEIAKLGIRQGMWGAVKKIEPGLRAYQNQTDASSSSMARINTKVGEDYLSSLGSESIDGVDAPNACAHEKPFKRNLPKLLVIGGAVVLACSLDRGLLTKAVIFGIARRFGNFGRKL